MNKALLSLWLVSAAIFTADIVIYSRSKSAGPVAECVVRKQPSMRVTEMAKTVPAPEGVPSSKSDQAQTASDAPSAAVTDRTAAVEPPAAASDNAHYDWVEIEYPGAYVHSGPSIDAAAISIFPVGAQLRILAYTNGWVQLQDAAGGQSGWVYQNYVAPIAAPGERRQTASQSSPPQPPAPAYSRQAQSRDRVRPQKASTAPPGPTPGPVPRWALGYDGEPQASLETPGDRPQRAWRQRDPSFADMYFRRYFRGY